MNEGLELLLPSWLLEDPSDEMWSTMLNSDFVYFLKVNKDNLITYDF